MNKKPSFFERLSGTMRVDRSMDDFEDEVVATSSPLKQLKTNGTHSPLSSVSSSQKEEQNGTGQLPIDLHQTGNEFVIRAFVAGVRPDELSISISRDMVEISGARMEREQISEVDYFSRELFWGSFSRVIQLPEEVDVDNASATAKDGLLVIILPKLDKARQTKLRVKAG